MKTIINKNTWKCEGCGHQRDTELEVCPYCRTPLTLETDENKKVTITIMGEEDIETEIEKIKERKLKGEKNNDPDLSTKKKEDDHREKRKKDIIEAITEAKKHED